MDTGTHSSESLYQCRCWLVIHPNGKAVMNAKDIYRLYAKPGAFAIIISPFHKGLKRYVSE